MCGNKADLTISLVSLSDNDASVIAAWMLPAGKSPKS